ncbi:MAG: AEC family transporter [Nitrospira sp.]|nr:AEC family transporter [Nitrospira sp.]MCP9462426.1 AEC family transporter [Nitrospira sp.]MCP9475256.1 AEC family transporter [Nitrospira sp.]
MFSPASSPLSLFLLLFVIGAGLRLFGLLGKRHAERLGTFVFSITLPATILISLDRVTFSPTAWKLPLAAWLVTVPLASIAWLLARASALERPTQGGFALAVGSINSIYFAFPVMLATFGEEGLARAILFDLGQTTLTLTVLYPVALRHGTGGASSSRTLRRLVASPPLWALTAIVSMKVSGLHLPDGLRSILTPVHWLTIPLASLVLGLSLNTYALRKTWPLTSLGVALRMGGGLLIGWAVAALLGLTGLERASVLLIAGMPSAVMAVIYAAEAKLDEDLVASIVALSICLGVALLPWLPALARMLVGSA